ncbi:hypothetical protein CDL15_Pgr028507 [Punica granatum]|uniref:RING-type domain-containing protein n=1 Tax=Punica granatum TaxID=22663 RepID=A0A218VXJ1_PUNGR|nr:hypothetical protein CDL15_Pgr028507 [Punica granatum]
MVVCKCRKATKLYCFVHKDPVCGGCICFPEHQICVVRTYSEWVIDGEYDWPPTCCFCQAVLEEGTSPQTTRLGCLHVMHTNCLVSHIKSFPPHTAPAGYICPACSVPIWPPKSIKDSGSRLHQLLKEAILQTGMEKNLFGNYPVANAEARGPPAHTAASDGLGESSTISLPSGTGGVGSSKFSESEIVEIDAPGSAGNFNKSPSPPGATTRKGPLQVDRQYSDISYYADDEDANRKKYNRRGPVHHKFLRALLPFWSSALPTLPVTAPPRKDLSHLSDVPEGRPRNHRSSRMDPRKILLLIAIMACLATMAILYYRIAQRGFGDDLPDEEQQSLQKL